ncbi:MAG: guanosine monophosphate reductase [Rhodobacteraceae bacterium]|nr:guanosine monophosphate reductase [Paracoccaceae bacterium]
MKISKAYCFDDVLIKPKYSDISSRKEIDLSIQFGKKNILNIPIISSPMDTVTEADMACKLSSLGGLGIIHRYNSISDQAQIVSYVKKSGAQNIGAAIGVGDDTITRVSALIESGVNIICIDIAHGHHSLMRHTLKTLRNTFGYDIHIMAGNVATLEGFNDLADWGASSVRVGVGGGSICSTRIQTGHGVPTFQSILDCAESDRNAILIADGGIRNSGDIVKCIAAGADAVMLGSLLAGTDESPGEVKYIDGEKIKTYRGMASKDAQLNWRGHYASVEGVTSFVKCQGPLENKVADLLRGIRSGLSYSGCRSIIEFQARAEFITQTPLGQIESGTHILDK